MYLNGLNGSYGQVADIATYVDKCKFLLSYFIALKQITIYSNTATEFLPSHLMCACGFFK